MTKNEVIQGKLTRLRPLEERDLENLVAWRNRHRHSFADSSLITFEGQAAWYESYCRRDNDLMWVIETLDERPVGCLGVYNIDRAARTAEGGRIMIGSAEDEGRGYAVDACQALIKRGRTALGIDVVYALIRADNQRVIPLYERLGFSRDPSRDATVEQDGFPLQLLGMSLSLVPEAGPAAPTDRSRPPIRVAVVCPGLTPSTYIRLVSPLAWLAARGEVASTMIREDQLHFSLRRLAALILRGRPPRGETRLSVKRSLRDADIVVFQRSTSPMGVKAQALARAAGAGIMYETDDDFLAIDRNTAAVGEYYSRPSVRESFVRLLAGADVVTTTTDVLAKAFRELATDVRVLPSSVDFAHIDTQPRPETPLRLVIGYAGTVTHGPDFECVEPALRRVLDEEGDAVHLQFFGFAPQMLLGLPNVEFVPYTDDYPAFLRTLSQVDWSFGIAPLADMPSKRGKTDNKYREYGACRIPAIYSDCPAYSRSVTDGRTGLLVPHTEEGWYKGLRRMLTDATLRENLARAAYDDVVARYSVAAAAQARLDTFRDILSRKAESVARGRA